MGRLPFTLAFLPFAVCLLPFALSFSPRIAYSSLGQLCLPMSSI